MTLTIGIDPGVAGAIAVVSAAGEVLVWDMPTIEVRGKKRISARHLRDLLVDIGPAVMVVVEDVQGVQGSGATSAFSFGRGCGVIEGVLAGLDRPVTYVSPQRWTKDLGVGSDKGAHRLAAQRLWPLDNLFDRVKDDGRADAALLAHWWMRGLG
jgi:crossover junction endodeoxyribonuclease RuvC